MERRMSKSANSALQTQWQNSELNVEHHTAQINGIDLHFVTQGDGLPVIFCHGVPHLWYTWHKQLPVVAAAGYKAVAIDVRGMGYSDTPQNKADYPGQTTLDLLGVLDYLGEEQAVFSGFDIGMNAIWDLAVLWLVDNFQIMAFSKTLNTLKHANMDLDDNAKNRFYSQLDSHIMRHFPALISQINTGTQAEKISLQSLPKTLKLSLIHI